MSRQITTSDEILGKDVVDPNGAILGIVTKIHIDMDAKELIGITIDQGLFRPDLFMGIDYVDRFAVGVVFLSKVPTDTYRGLKVLTNEGKTIGTVKSVVVSDSILSELVVVPKSVDISKHNISIPVSEIEEIGFSVILKKGFML
ncbi:MAG: PRC-barrel domain-containing protein [Candidatus Woesearchaeota archaeon]|jgi:sporulation protein YlmC with PRC-barrel domain|nr:PRC-barrel domain-containing protein [Candidatus Woesearchaeota archaeon]